MTSTNEVFIKYTIKNNIIMFHGINKSHFIRMEISENNKYILQSVKVSVYKNRTEHYITKPYHQYLRSSQKLLKCCLRLNKKVLF